MPELKIKCPRCRNTISTGVTMTLREFCRANLTDQRLECEKCKKLIKWSKEDVLAISFCWQFICGSRQTARDLTF